MSADTGPPVALKVEPLSRTAFVPFGDVIETSTAVRRFTINDGHAERFHDLASLTAMQGGRLGLSIFRAQPVSLPFRVAKMERHPLGSQAFIPLSGEPYLVVVAPAGPAPALRDIRVFRANRDQGVNYAPGVWHHPLLALNRICDFAVIDRIGEGDNCDEITLRPLGVITR